MARVYRLKISQVEQSCLFELTWGNGRQLSAQLPFPNPLETCYRVWQRSYLQYYQSALRGRSVASGKMTPQQDWRSLLVKAERALEEEFAKWLRQEPLYTIRRELGRRDQDARPANINAPTDLLISCDSSHLGRLPWETWEIAAEFGSVQPIRIGRLPINVRERAVPSQPQRGKARILVILGDDTGGLSFESEQSEIAALSRLADIHTVGWKPGADIERLKQAICDRLQEPAGWDMLLFFGHSNEAKQVGGEIAIAPHTSLTLRELEPYLRQAKAHGLKFALFNSCKGLDIAQTLIDLGLNQVVMREPIHDRVAYIFLKQFMRSLAQFDDVHTALQKATQFLHSSHKTYPSAYLVPSLFRHADAVPFRLQPVGWRAWLRAWLPQTRWQAAALCIIAGLSLIAPVGNSLLAGRVWTQALYRDLTQQVPTASPPVLLVQIDDESIRRGIPSGEPYPIDRAYLAEIVERLSALDAQVIGIDYLLDRSQAENDVRFAETLTAAVAQNRWLVFGTILESGDEVDVHDDLASLDWAMQGYTNTPQWYLRALPAARSCRDRCPFVYLLALAQRTRLTAATRPDLASSDDLRETLLDKIQDGSSDDALHQLYSLRLPLLASLSRFWRQRWLHPVLDFSLPPEQVYERLSAYQLLESSIPQMESQFDWAHQVVIVASGGYGEAGTGFNKDYFPLPPAIAYWQQADRLQWLTGGEVNAYGVHHFLHQHYVVPIPDLWLVGIGAIAGAGLSLFLRRRSPTRHWLALAGLSAGYGLFSLQLYVSGLVLLPWLLPTATVWLYGLPTRSR